MNLQKKKMPKGYAVLWGVLTAAYAVWMTFFMNKIVLVNFERTSDKTVGELVNGVLTGVYHQNITGMEGQHWLYPIWVIVSCITMLLFIVYIKKYLYGTVGKVAKTISMIVLLFGCAFITWYGFLKNPREFTASMIGLDFPWQFRGWGIFSTAAVFMNIMLMYNKFNYNNRLGVIAGSLGCAALYMTINLPSFGEELVLSSPRCMAHWSGALLFAVGCAAPVVLFLFSMAFKRKNKKFIMISIAFAILLAIMLVLLITVGKDGLIENIPMWGVYAVLFTVNYTPLFNEKEETKKETVAA